MLHEGDKAAAFTGQLVIYAVMIAANGANADIELCDALTVTSSDELSFNILDGDTAMFDFTPLGGVIFNTGLSTDITGSGARVWIWSDKVTTPA